MPLSAHQEPTVYLIDPDPAVRSVLRDVARSKSLALEAYASADLFFEASAPTNVGCVMVDLAAPGIDGLGALDQFARRGIDLAVIFLAAEFDAATVVRALKGGAVNFLEKPCTRPELWEAAVEEAIAHNVAGRRRRTLRGTMVRRLGRLTDGENEVLRRLLDGQSNRDIASELGISVRAVEQRRSRLMKKMGAESLAELVRMALTARDLSGP